MISVIKNLSFTLSSTPIALHSNDVKLSLEFSAIARNVVIKQLLTEAVNKCSGDHIPGMPFGNCGGVATSMQPFSGVVS